MKIVISFATEDFVTPAHDEVLLRLSAILHARGIRGSFHLTGELARELRERRRTDVIESLKKHEIGYHSNTHGASPFIAGVCEDHSWDEAVAILMNTESRGIMDIAEIFDRYPKYYVIEFVKAPQLIYALRGLGVGLVGFSGIPSSENTPFSWFTGSLCFNAPHMGVESPPAPGRLQGFKDEFDKYYADALKGKAEGVLKLFNHPYKFIYNNNIASWVSENSIYKTYDIHADWKIPHASMYDTDTVNRLFDDFERLLDYVLSKEEVEFMATSELMAQYRRRPPKFVEINSVLQLSEKIKRDFTYQQIDGVFYSPAEIFGLLAYALAYYSENKKLPDTTPYRDLLGPVQPIPLAPETTKLPVQAILSRMKHVNREIDFYRRVPAALDLDGIQLPAGHVLPVWIAILNGIAHNQALPDIGWDECRKAPDFPRIAEHPYFTSKEWTKPSYPEGFKGTNLCEACRLQSWSYKPAWRI